MSIVLTLVYHFYVKAVFKELVGNIDCKIVFNRMLLMVFIRRGIYNIKNSNYKNIMQNTKTGGYAYFYH